MTLCWKCHRAVHDHHLRVEVVSKTPTDLVVNFWKLGGWKP